MSKPKPSSPTHSAIPILMRLPDLRQKTGPRAEEPSITPAAASPGAEQSACEAPQAEPAESTVEVQLQSAPPIEQREPATASSTAAASPPASDRAAEEVAASVVEEKPIVSEPVRASASIAEVPVVSKKNELAGEKENVPQVAAAKADVRDASPADAAEPVTPAAARRQRALERQRRQAAEPPQQRSWWTTHLPIIGIGFVVALILTIYVGRRNRVPSADDSHAAVEVPELEIDTGEGHDSLLTDSSEPGMFAVNKRDEGPRAELEVSPKPKSPPLLSAKPQVTETEPPHRNDVPEAEPIRTAARSNTSGADITNHFVTSPGADSAPAAAELTADAAANYPSTEPAVYRPGGRAPREARVPNYPETSTPHLR